ncbi:MAG: bifunctional tetrahydrofolate synthase/dihydrofolate synthase [Lysobacterales bacterium CG17_big_fil_post_rev_8_21_14_2_50_64_11]|nr:MAG: bifunctional tetrahydrofolate synthase/dihydrofolate synthase [Xanthomonadales bacterium CG17_big_fil_post_rev_8_21_14_2_50_64_11]PIX60181.1 MAG: bifunctional tetrahydrofolate synthase/dihydrofolate synthase [Xanthomonadales bacterium CG_4_10_14_3_um_filter_64_11]
MMARSLVQWLDYQQQLHPQAIAMGLERVRVVAESMTLARPARYVISVAGTNGKGSTVAFIEAIAAAAGLRVGAYSSPHLLRYNERLRIDGADVADGEWIAAFERVEAARGEVALTYFEFGTLAALDILARTGLDLAVLEVGLGGRLDAVNLIDADVAVITSVALDHQALLGADRERIGHEKAGIMRAGRPVVLAEADPPSSVLRHAYAIGAFAIRAGCDYRIERTAEHWRWLELNETLTLPHPAMLAPAQLDNAAAAIAALRALDLPVSREAIAQGVAAMRLPGRLQRMVIAVAGGEAEVVLDVGHNPQAAAQIALWLQHATERRTLALFAALGDKDIAGIVAPLTGAVAHWWLAGLHGLTERGLEASALAARVACELPQGAITETDDVAAALAMARSALRQGDRLLVFGSFYTVAAALRELPAWCQRAPV